MLLRHVFTLDLRRELSGIGKYCESGDPSP